MKPHVADALSRLNTKGEEKPFWDYWVAVLTLPHGMLARTTNTKTTDFEFIKKPEHHFAPFIPEVCFLADIMADEQVQVPTLPDFIAT